MRNLIAGMMLAAGLMAFAAPVAVRAEGTDDCTAISTDKGPVSGLLSKDGGACVYKGVPYAAAPVGGLRFRMPKEHASWTEPLKAEKFGEQCLQAPMSLFPSDKIMGSEDCLYLNVWHAKGVSAGSKPVMVFVHGGGFMYGAGDWALYDGVKLARYRDVVLVTINYRLNALGFMVHPSLRDEDGYLGNYGMFDVIESLKWVKKNIANFGGDPNNVTLFGESAGGITVGLMLVSPLAKGLFQRAVIESGPVHLLVAPESKLSDYGVKAAEKLGCKDPATAAACLRKVDGAEFIRQTPSTLVFVTQNEAKGIFLFEPSIDGKFLPDNPIKLFQQGKFAVDVPVILGSNMDEASYFTISRTIKTIEDFRKNLTTDAAGMKDAFNIDFSVTEAEKLFPPDKYPTVKKAYNAMMRDFAFTCPTRMIAKAISKYQPDTYLYLFAKPPDEKGIAKEWGAFHGSELPFIFGNMDFMGIKFESKANTALTKKVSAYWASFAKTGKPQAEGVMEWKPFGAAQNNYQRLDVEITSGENFMKEQCDYIEPLLEGF